MPWMPAPHRPPGWRPPQERKREADRQRGSAASRGYGRKWQRVRLEHLKRSPLCVECHARGEVVAAAVVDHVIPHKGDQRLFWATGNWQSLCKPCHDLKTAREDGRFGGRASARPEWLRPSLVPLVIVCGPPASGKSHYVAARAGAGDLIVDLDRIAAELSGEPEHLWDRSWLSAALRRRNALLGELGKVSGWPAAWLIVSEPVAEHRQWWADKLQPREVVVLEVRPAQCLRRIADDPARDHVRDATAVDRWWSLYRRRDGDRVEAAEGAAAPPPRGRAGQNSSPPPA